MRALLCCLVVATAANASGFLPKEAYAGESVVVYACPTQPIENPAQPRRSADLLNMFVPILRGAGLAVGCAEVTATFENVEAGNYRVGYQLSWPDAGFVPLGTLTVAPAQPSAPAFTELSGNWFDPRGPGRGLNIVQGRSGALMVVWLDHGLDHSVYEFAPPYSPTWLIAPAGRWVTPTLFRGHLYRSKGTASNQTWRPSALQTMPVGFASLRFTNAQEVIFEAEFLDAPSKKIATLQRFSF